jgi:hypothetical protein
MRSVLSWSLALSAGLVACHPTATFTAQGGVCPTRAYDCTFEIIEGKPARDFQKVGVIEIEAFYVRNVPKTEADFRKEFGPVICHAGGDAVVPAINGDGRYVLATIVKWVDSPDAGPACPKKLPDAGVKDAGPADTGSVDAASKLDATVPPAHPDAGTSGPLSFDQPDPTRDSTSGPRRRALLNAGAAC